ncbi:unnamed protein product [Mycena citricolor]|uniref:RING-type domain-containing protein n=1 Tax=Mycena citricolor TaxID=2018698 RepID=A0AAD2Q4A5_9AGAR|nr:unnamed protein product [Mycena citricolor]
MLSLGPGSACDVCLDSFTSGEGKSPSSIPCGHVFCVACLRQIAARPVCPLCRSPFQPRHIVRLHVDLDNVRNYAAADGTALVPGTESEARQLQDRINAVAQRGASEVQTTELLQECRRFLGGVDLKTFPELRTSYCMMKYMCHVKRMYLEQSAVVSQHTLQTDLKDKDIQSLRTALDLAQSKRDEHSKLLEETERHEKLLDAQCSELTEQLATMEAEMKLLSEQNEAAQAQLLLVTDELQQLRAEVEFSSPEGESLAELPIESMPLSPITDLKPPTAPDLEEEEEDEPPAPFLSPWAALIDSKTEPLEPMRVYCGAAGCPHSCNCVPFLLFSPGSREAAAARALADSAVTPPLLGFSPPSGLSLHLQQQTDRSRSHSRPRSRSLSRAASPVAGPLKHHHHHHPSSSAQQTHMRGRLHDILHDPFPTSSSLPNMSRSHFLPPSPPTPPQQPPKKKERTGKQKERESLPEPLPLYSQRQSSPAVEAPPRYRVSGSPPQDRRTATPSAVTTPYVHPPMLYIHPPMLHSDTRPFVSASAAAAAAAAASSTASSQASASVYKSGLSQTVPSKSAYPRPPFMYTAPVAPAPPVSAVYASSSLPNKAQAQSQPIGFDRSNTTTPTTSTSTSTPTSTRTDKLSRRGSSKRVPPRSSSSALFAS